MHAVIVWHVVKVFRFAAVNFFRAVHMLPQFAGAPSGVRAFPCVYPAVGNAVGHVLLLFGHQSGRSVQRMRGCISNAAGEAATDAGARVSR